MSDFYSDDYFTIILFYVPHFEVLCNYGGPKETSKYKAIKIEIMSGETRF